MDKCRELGLVLEEGKTVSVPGIRQLPLTLECKVLYQQTQGASHFPQSIVDRYYPMPYDDHTVYYGEIVSAYIIQE
jgi:flavin reductase (DIM6/NTAB) family NADH-FMN oxidoreductase RutF